MANMDSTDNEKCFKEGKCCAVCPAGTYMKEDCSATQAIKCSPCPQGRFTEQINRLKHCIGCSICVKNSFKVSNCTTVSNTVWQCKPGFYCDDQKCEHCRPWTLCSEGEGVKEQPTHKTNTVCTPCGDGTYSNVTDHSSPCKPHFRCEDYGLELKTPGTPTADVLCQQSRAHCTWMLPAGLWAGLVLTIVLVAAFIFWRAKRRSYRAGMHTKVKIGTEQVVPPPELLSHCQETCNDCKLPPSTSVSFGAPEIPVGAMEAGRVFSEGCPPSLLTLSSSSDDHLIIRSMTDSLDSSFPITPMKVSFAEPNPINSSKGYSSNYLRSCSEPQEDEWCGT
ncbi:tumor necrosis factor receptor superfamily member 5 isoform X1 [Fundulus heteroclitus]|uniref:tumor necrosis factor receptor superfamily member 5 isoform X1 n=1 Tax=Fundulus heteroclitus TaxID=8078 RepID=UPI00165BCF62|nr:tumor necrosis factor receptor superfamily member 5 isoform X1 [Fundulus heteroclitus]